jgi:hypothetical protein
VLVDPVHWLSRPAPGAGPVALLRIFVRRCHGGLGSSRACRESANQKTEGQSAFGAVKFSGAAKAKRRRHYPWLTRRSLANRRLTLAPPQDLLLCAKHLFVAAMVAGVHPGTGKLASRLRLRCDGDHKNALLRVSSTSLRALRAQLRAGTAVLLVLP